MELSQIRALTAVSDRIKLLVLEAQDLAILSFQTLTGIFKRPHYLADTVEQMDILGVGSLTIVVLTGLFAGMAMALQLSVELAVYGAEIHLGKAVTVAIVREMGPVLTALMVAGRVCSGIAAELGAMKVGQQIDALRVIGVDPAKKLVIPRLLSVLVMLPVLTIISDAIATLGGYVISMLVSHQSSPVYWSSVGQAFTFKNFLGGLIKPFVFGYIIAMVGCYFGLQTAGGTRGVGKAATHAVVTASILVLVSNFLITKLVISLLGWRG
jgi:phospholipid/cholesterol/gamma-HCH transport system permease protein